MFWSELIPRDVFGWFETWIVFETLFEVFGSRLAIRCWIDTVCGDIIGLGWIERGLISLLPLGA